MGAKLYEEFLAIAIDSVKQQLEDNSGDDIESLIGSAIDFAAGHFETYELLAMLENKVNTDKILETIMDMMDELAFKDISDSF